MAVFATYTSTKGTEGKVRGRCNTKHRSRMRKLTNLTSVHGENVVCCATAAETDAQFGDIPPTFTFLQIFHTL